MKKIITFMLALMLAVSFSGFSFGAEITLIVKNSPSEPVYDDDSNRIEPYEFETLTEALNFAAAPDEVETPEDFTEVTIDIQKNISLEDEDSTITLSDYDNGVLTKLKLTGRSTVTSNSNERHIIADNPNLEFELSGLTLRGNNGGGISIRDGNVVINGVTFRGIDATGNSDSDENDGGAIKITGGKVSFTGTNTFNGNTAENGGAIYIASNNDISFGGPFTFENNTANSDGGAVYLASSSARRTHEISGTFINNVATTGNGGAIYIPSGQEVKFFDTLGFSGNKALASNGGAIFIEGTGKVLANDAIVTFDNNNASWPDTLPSESAYDKTSGFGGALYVSGSGSAEFGTVTFKDNKAPLGGAVYSASGTINFAGTTVFGVFGSANTAYDGGAIYLSDGTVTFTASSTVSFTGNIAEDNGGAIYIPSGSSGKITFSVKPTFSSNEANKDKGLVGNGGAIWWGASLATFLSEAEFNSNFTSGTPQTVTSNAGNGGAVYFSGTGSDTLNIGSELTFSNNDAWNSGGAIYADNVGKINITGIIIDQNNNSRGTQADAPISGGGFLYASSGTITITDVAISNQTAFLSGGAILGLNININSSDFTGNSTTSTAGSEGGVLYVPKGGKLTVNNSRFIRNNSAGNGGAIETEESTLTITESVFSDNEAQDNGGAIYLASQCNANITNCTFDSNQADRGGAIRAYGNLTVDKNYFEGNYASLEGGAIYFYQIQGVSSFTIKSSMLRSNIAGGGSNGKGGGALYLELENAVIDSCTFDANSISGGSEVRGGAIYFDTSKSTSTKNSTIVNCTFTANKVENGTTSNYGGALYVSGRVDIKSCAFTMSNTAKDRGGALYIAGAKATISGTLIIGNSAPLGSDVFSEADSDIYWSSSGYNRVGVYGLANGNTSWIAHPAPESDRENSSWTTETFYGKDAALSINEYSEGIPPFVGAGKSARLETLMLNEAKELADSDRATNAIPTNMRYSFPELDQRGVNRRAMKTTIDIGPIFFDGTVPGDPTEPITTYTIQSVMMSGIPNTLRSIGQTASLIAMIRYTNGRTAYGGDDEGSEPVTWSSSNQNVVRIDQKGNITALATTPNNSYVTISVSTKRNKSDGTPATDSRPVRVLGQYSYLNISAEYQNQLSSYIQELAEHDIALNLADVNSSSVKSTSFQRSFKAAWDADTVSQITDLTSSTPSFNTLTSYTASGYTPSKNAAANINFQSRSNGDVFPLVYSWTFSGSEIKSLLGYDLSQKTLNANLADELFKSLRIDFQGASRTFQVVGGSGVSAKDAYTNQALVLTKADGNKGVSISLTAYLANVNASGNDSDGPQLMGAGSRKLLVVPDGTNDGAITGSMWMIQKGSSSGNNDNNNGNNGNQNPNNNNNNNNNNGNSGSGGGGGGGCSSLGLGLLGLLFIFRRR